MKRMKLLPALLLIVFGIMNAFDAQAQGWARLYSPDHPMWLSGLYPLPDSTFWATGHNVQDTTGVRLMRVDADGNILQVFDYDSLYNTLNWNTITPDKGVAYVSLMPYDTSKPRMYFFGVLRVDGAGQKQWLKTIDSFYLPPSVSGSIGNINIDTTDDNGFICALNLYDTTLQTQIITLKRLDANGNEVWTRRYYDTISGLYPFALRNSGDGGFIAGIKKGQNFTRLFKVDGAGDFVWEYIWTRPGTFWEPGIAYNGDITMIGSNSADTSYIVRISQSTGQELWGHSYPNFPGTTGISHWLEADPETFALITVNTNTPSQGQKYGFALSDTLGNYSHFRFLPTANLGADLPIFGFPYLFKKTADNAYIMGGSINRPSPTSHWSFIIKMDSLGQVYPNTISGNAFYDRNVDCDRTLNEELLNGKIISFTSATDTFRAMTTDSGYYAIGINPGTYDVDVQMIAPYWEETPCNPAQVTIPVDVDTIVHFGFDALAQLPYITMSAHTRRRICDSNTYTLEYCNQGPGTFYGVINITFDTLVQIDSASVPWAVQSGGNVSFVDTSGLALNECKTIEVYYTIPCDPALNGVNLCINAHAYLDSVANLSPLWDESNLKLNVTHNTVTDSVEFELENMGNGDMDVPQYLIVIEDNIIMVRQPIQLVAGQSYNFAMPANGSTWRATVPQTPFNPYSAFTTAAIEGAGRNQQNQFSRGFINQFPVNGLYSFDHNLCGPVLGSYDPNQKTVSPEGLAPDHIIDSTAQLEYTIDFQNTGNDTAYIVRIVDTLATYLDPQTIRPGVSSHSYKFRFLSARVIEFTFEAIYLPDSISNEPASHGFVTFKIDQVPNNPNGSVINNNVSIYFDFNPPVVTNTAWVQVGEFKVTGIEVAEGTGVTAITAWPNPFTDHVNIEVTGGSYEKIELNMYDLSGRLVQKQVTNGSGVLRVEGAGLDSGTYILELTAQGKVLGRAKIVATH